jgi:hypothetical protein
VKEKHQRAAVAGKGTSQGQQWLEKNRRRRNKIIPLPEEIWKNIDNQEWWLYWGTAIPYHSTNPCYTVAKRTVESYYNGTGSPEEIRIAYLTYCRKICGNGRGIADKISTAFEYFCRVNACCAVKHNNEEGRRIVEHCGMEWEGTTYYNARYYYRWKHVHRILKKAGSQLAMELSDEMTDLSHLEEENRFQWEGGITFHSVWQHLQKQNNFPKDHYGLRRPKQEPPHGFVYLYRNYYDRKQENEVERLLEQMQKHSGKNPEGQHMEGIGVKERYYNHGVSYLVDFEAGVQWGAVNEETYQRNMEFLKNFRLYRVSGCIECLGMTQED